MNLKNYVIPEEIIAPQSRLKDLKIIYDGSKGNPLSTGHPTCFIAPDFL